MGLFISEVSNPIMHARMVLKHLNRRYTKAYEVAELSYISNNILIILNICLVVLFIYGRVLIGTAVVIKTVTCSENNFIIKILCVGLAL